MLETVLDFSLYHPDLQQPIREVVLGEVRREGLAHLTSHGCQPLLQLLELSASVREPARIAFLEIGTEARQSLLNDLSIVFKDGWGRGGSCRSLFNHVSYYLFYY